MTYMSCEPAQTEQNLARLKKIYDDVQRSGVTEKELALAKTKLKSRVVLSSERPRNRLFSVGGNWLMRHEYRAVQDDLRSIDQVSCESIRELLARYSLAHRNTMTIGPLTEVKATE
jgi:predicted Zn-dependent peptidase